MKKSEKIFIALALIIPGLFFGYFVLGLLLGISAKGSFSYFIAAPLVIPVASYLGALIYIFLYKKYKLEFVINNTNEVKDIIIGFTLIIYVIAVIFLHNYYIKGSIFISAEEVVFLLLFYSIIAVIGQSAFISVYTGLVKMLYNTLKKQKLL
jgi:hypothetical protein